MLIVIVRYVFEEDGKYVGKEGKECLYELKCEKMIGLIFQKELILTKQMHQKSVIFLTLLVLFKIKVLDMSCIFAMVVTI